MIAESVVSELIGQGVRFYGIAIVSPFSTKDSGWKCQQINFLIEKCGYHLADERGFPKRPEIIEAATNG